MASVQWGTDSFLEAFVDAVVVSTLISFAPVFFSISFSISALSCYSPPRLLSPFTFIDSIRRRDDPRGEPEDVRDVRL